MEKSKRRERRLQKEKYKQKDKKYVSKKKRAQRKKRAATVDVHHMTVKERTALKKKNKDKAIKISEKKQRKRLDATKAFGGVRCAVCKKEKYKKKFSERQFELANPKCIECASKNEKL